ncbi:MAG: response regulator [Clostridia bacterium]|nr:response regulator [Clostridia bacterium]
MKAVIVDDEAWCADELEEILSHIKTIEVVAKYSNPRTFIEQLNRDAPDLVFVDVQMPGINGLELAKIIKEKHDGIKAVLMSENPSYACDSYAVGGDDFVLKPIKAERIRFCLSRFLKMAVNE